MYAPFKNARMENTKEYRILRSDKENTVKTGKFSLSYSLPGFALSQKSDQPFRKEIKFKQKF